ncbi:MAG: arylsulfatase [Saprospiraceae bacterium]|nr:arylsulfatase [Saprospiraceae bacterium]
MSETINLLSGLILGILTLASCASEESVPPNVLLIMVDDMGYSDLGCYGGEIFTPHLDALAEGGLRFTQFNNTARCWATRAALITGYYPQQIGRDNAPGIKGGAGGKRPDWADLVPNRLVDAGYRSYHSGKWHIDGMPIENGFDRSYYLADQGRFFSPKKHFLNDQPLAPVKRESGFYATVEITNHAIDQLSEHVQDHPENPFFSYVAYTAPHFPLHALQEDIDAVGDRYAEGWDVRRRKRWKRIQELGIAKGKLSKIEDEIGPPYDFPEALELLGPGEVNRPVTWETLTPEQQKFQQTKMTLHAAMIERVDIEIGRIIALLKTRDVFENTLIVFLSDNGASAEIMVRSDGHDPEAIPGSASSYLCLGPGWSSMCNTPFRRHKTWVHEGGSCTPLIMHWPEGITARGELRHTYGHVIDIVPTLLELAGSPADQNIKEALPGKSLTSIFSSDANSHRPLWYYHEGNRAVRQGNWKLVADKNGPWELFNLAKDRSESIDLSQNEPSKVLDLEKKWQGMLDEMRTVAPELEQVKKAPAVTTKELE